MINAMARAWLAVPTVCLLMVFGGTAQPVSAGQPAGSYIVDGTSPGSGSPYEGTVMVVATGATYRVTWRIGGTTYSGIGIMQDNVLSVAYFSRRLNGIAVYEQVDGNRWVGSWAVKGSSRLGTESWTRR